MCSQACQQWWLLKVPLHDESLHILYIRIFSKTLHSIRIQYCQLHFSCTVRSEVDKWSLQPWNTIFLYPGISNFISTGIMWCKWNYIFGNKVGNYANIAFVHLWKKKTIVKITFSDLGIPIRLRAHHSNWRMHDLPICQLTCELKVKNILTKYCKINKILPHIKALMINILLMKRGGVHVGIVSFPLQSCNAANSRDALMQSAVCTEKKDKKLNSSRGGFLDEYSFLTILNWERPHFWGR